MKKLLVAILLVLLIFSLYRKNQTKQSTPTDDNQAALSKNTKRVVTKIPLIHKVEKGEGLWHIAVKELGDGERWRELADANAIEKPYVLYVGQEIKIPGKETELITEEETSNSYTLTQVSEHNNKDSCWLAIEGKVYDVTPYIAGGFHPGKAAILLGCGKDATTLFNTRPMGSGTAHSERARKMLPTYLIGTLED
jgi:cytochrome b involved in lipid metabolism